MLEVKDLSAGYGIAKISSANFDKNCVIRNISFKAENGESLCILGPNGSGKSTLLKSIAGLLEYRGLVLFDKVNAAELSRKEYAKKTALLEQNTRLYFPYTVYETVSMGRYPYSQGLIKNLSAEDKQIIKDVMIKLDIYNIKDKMTNELSGGTLQRVFLAKTFTQTPDIILLDEPANHLDLKHQIELLDTLSRWVKENNKTLIGVFHDFNLARRFGDKIIIMDNGTIAADGKTDEVLNSNILNSVFGVDISTFMRESFSYWK